MNMIPDTMQAFKPADYKSDIKPVWCPGCGDFGVLNALAKALSRMALPVENVAVISGIGCSSRLPAYTNCYGFHGVHGRSLALATGLKLARPDLAVITFSGDGDGFSIGGNHFLHACRRNADITYVVMDNRIYGMTKGQPSPTTEPDWNTAIAPGGTGVNPFNPLLIALASGANFIGRGYAGDVGGTAKLIVDAVRTPGFSFVHLLSPCVTFRPDEQPKWKKAVHDSDAPETHDLGRAAERLMTDDGMTLGVLYRGNRPPYQPVPRADLPPSHLEAEFAV
jgi:2-oxoglutarate ferredoxin oxidoreductase subunit beta